MLQMRPLECCSFGRDMGLIDRDEVSCIGLLQLDTEFRVETTNLESTDDFTCYNCVDSCHCADFELH